MFQLLTEDLAKMLIFLKKLVGNLKQTLMCCDGRL